MAMRMIMEEAETSAEIVLRKEELIRYMAWRSPETIKTYENYFKAIEHYNVQDKIHEGLEKDMNDYVRRQSDHAKLWSPLDGTRSRTCVTDAHGGSGLKQESLQSSGWTKLLALGGA